MAERKIYHSIAELVGETPLVEVTNYEKEHDLDATILAKLEFKDIPGVPELIAEKGLAFDPFYDLLQKYADEHGWYYINQGRNPETRMYISQLPVLKSGMLQAEILIFSMMK